MEIAGQNGVARGFYGIDYHDLGPRIGLAYQASPKLVIRTGFGMFYGRDEDIGITNRLPNNPPFITSATFTGDQTNPAFLFKNGIPSNALSVA